VCTVTRTRGRDLRGRGKFSVPRRTDGYVLSRILARISTASRNIAALIMASADDVASYFSADMFIWFLRYRQNANSSIKPPNNTRLTPTIAEYRKPGTTSTGDVNASPNLATAKPNVITTTPVLTHAR